MIARGPTAFFALRLIDVLAEVASMTCFLGVVLAAALISQAKTDHMVSGDVVDSQGKPVADARVVFYAPPVGYLKGDPVEVQATTDVSGKFSLVRPPLGRTLINGVNLLAYKSGRAIGGAAFRQSRFRVVLREPQPRTLKIEGPDGKPVVGARVAIRIVYIFGATIAEVPESLADALATGTGPDGTTSIGYLAARDQMVAVRITADSIGSQDFLLVKQPGRDSEPAVITVKLKSTGAISGRLVDENGQAVADQPVEVWSMGDEIRLYPNLVGFTGEPISTGATVLSERRRLADRRIVPGDGAPARHGSIFSEWITIGTQPDAIPTWVQRPLKTIRGRVVDRQGKPVLGAAVFQSGDGPERTTATTDADGHFSLGGFRQIPVFVFVRGDGFRFHGQLIGADDVVVKADYAQHRAAGEK